MFFYRSKAGETFTLDEIIEMLNVKIRKAKRVDERLVSLIEYRDALVYLKSGAIFEFL